jgi:NAD(P)-dependent dehydrogenase (short-subunit alcohol dehydrogenase family)
VAAGRVALVTGGTGALGSAIVRRLLADGAVVAAPYVVDEERDRLLGALAEGERARVEVERCDVTDGAAVDALVASVIARHGRLDVLVMAVGGFAGGRLVETDRATWDSMLAMNLTSAFVAARAVVPHMIAARSGRVVVIGSRAVVPPAPGFIAYTAAKAGVIALAQALAQEVKADGVTVNVVLPSTMDTPANRAAMPDVDPRTWVPVAAVADAIGFLTSPGAGYVNGTLLAM